LQVKAKARGDKWSVLIDLPRKNGRRKQKRFTSRTKGETERLALKYLAEAKAKKAQPQTRTVGDLLDAWLADVRPSIESRTYASYESVVRLYLRPELGPDRLCELSAEAISSARDAWMSASRKDKRKGTISGTTARYVLRTLKTALTFGIERKWLDENPARYVKPPKASESEKRPLEAEEVRSLLSAARNTALFCPVLIALYSGVRRGELLAVKWEDFDLVDGSLTVRRSLEVDRLDGYAIKEKAPKSASSKRAIPIPASVVEELREYKVAQAQRLQVLGLDQESETLVFDRGDGQPWHPDTFGQAWIEFAKTCGVRRVRFHDLRATFASLLIEAGVDPVTVQHFLGHSTLNMTMRVYAKATTRAKRAAADRLEASLMQPSETSCDQMVTRTSDTLACAIPTKAKTLDKSRVSTPVSGSGCWTRTSDPLINSQLLYQLS